MVYRLFCRLSIAIATCCLQYWCKLASYIFTVNHCMCILYYPKWYLCFTECIHGMKNVLREHHLQISPKTKELQPAKVRRKKYNITITDQWQLLFSINSFLLTQSPSCNTHAQFILPYLTISIIIQPMPQRCGRNAPLIMHNGNMHTKWRNWDKADN